jgi:hypothetical protein
MDLLLDLLHVGGSQKRRIEKGLTRMSIALRNKQIVFILALIVLTVLALVLVSMTAHINIWQALNSTITPAIIYPHM